MWDVGIVDGAWHHREEIVAWLKDKFVHTHDMQTHLNDESPETRSTC